MPDTAPTRQNLGRVLVTIDDLEALIGIMRQEATDSTSVQVQFSGGYFTNVEDLRQLSDSEILSLKIHSDSTEVNLEPTQAVAIGAATTTGKIQNVWARTRQTKAGTRLSAASWTMLGVAATLLLLIPAALAVLGILPYYRAGDSGLNIAGFLLVAVFSYRMIRIARGRPGAVGPIHTDSRQRVEL